MPKKQLRPGRTLAIFFVAVVVLCGLAALGGTAAPRLGLDLRGGTRITLSAEQQNPSQTQLQEAASIIDSRVNGQGVAESEVSTQGNRNIIVEIPGARRKDLVDDVSRTAQLRFRLVAAAAQGSKAAVQKATESPSPSASPSQKSDQKSKKKAAKKKESSRNRVAPGFDTTAKKRATTGKTSDESESASPSETASPSGKQSGSAGSGSARVTQALEWTQTAKTDPKLARQFARFTCPAPGEDAAPRADEVDQPLITCDEGQNKYLLSESLIEGTQLQSASFGPPNSGIGWAVQLNFKGNATDTFAQVTKALAQNGQQFAIVLDGQVLSAPGVTAPGGILDGRAEITGDFTEQEAGSLANSLKYGALPLRFPESGIQVEDVGATLAGNQLQAGITAGAIGLLLVMIYCLFYYRGLGLVVIASLLIAGVITYAAVLVLGSVAGFTLTLPGIAGLIVAVGITADSFIVYFERIRDEMREGRSMRVAVETGWRQARNTCLAADAVSFLAAVVLYIFAVGVVKGFAFALGISTLIDVAVFFWFTKPMVSTLARRPFFNTGHRFSGLSQETLGIDAPATAGGRA